MNMHATQDPEDLAWLDRLLEAVSDCTMPDSPMGPLACRYGAEEGCWDVAVYPTPVQIVGGEEDGALVAPGFALDVDDFCAAFDRVVDVVWHSFGFPKDEGPRLAVEGAFQGREVFLQVLAYAPADEEPGLILDGKGRETN